MYEMISLTLVCNSAKVTATAELSRTVRCADVQRFELVDLRLLLHVRLKQFTGSLRDTLCLQSALYPRNSQCVHH